MSQTAHSYLFVPGDRPERFPKAVASGPDVLVLDLEDAVGPDNKAQARDCVADWLAQGNTAMLRVNAMETPWYEEDMAVATAYPQASVMLPKADAYSATHTLGLLPRCRLVALLETIDGYMNLASLAKVSGLQRIAFGSVDFSTESGIVDTGHALTAVRTQIVLASRHAGLPAPIDGVSLELQDEGLMREAALESRSLGFGAKLCIHPRQVAAVNEAWRPAQADVDWAERVVQAFKKSGGNATSVDGQMVDKPVYERATQILHRAIT